MSTLMRDFSHFELRRAVTVTRGAGLTRLADTVAAIERGEYDPFARIFPARIQRVGARVLGATAAPAGPVIERYGSANPWPWARFETGAP